MFERELERESKWESFKRELTGEHLKSNRKEEEEPCPVGLVFFSVSKTFDLKNLNPDVKTEHERGKTKL